MDLSSDLIRSLAVAENHFLEILITEFSLRRRGQGSELTISFDRSIPAIWTRDAKYELQRRIPEFESKAKTYQDRFDAFLLKSQENELQFDDPDFPFRYASGGTLPVLRIDKKEYYCLFYREIFPAGWNIANGGSDDTFELLSPLDTIERELREELVIFDDSKRKRYSFPGNLGKPLDHPQFTLVHRFLNERHGWDLSKFEEVPTTLKWLNGPDYLTVKTPEVKIPRRIPGCFLNINAEDFGIEVDRIAKINLDKTVRLLDGETIGSQLVNAPVGLFEVSNFNNMVREGKTEFFPDLFYWDADKYEEGGRIQDVIENDFLPDIDSFKTDQENSYYWNCKKKFDLCPVTRRIIERYLSLKAENPIVDRDTYDVFISFGGDDVAVAQLLYDYLARQGLKSYFSKESIGNPDFHRAIDDALDTAHHLVAVGTKVANLQRPWVEYEYTAFHNNILSGLNPNAKIHSFISGFEPPYLPLPLRILQTIVFEPNKMDEGLASLIGVLRI